MRWLVRVAAFLLAVFVPRELPGHQEVGTGLPPAGAIVLPREQYESLRVELHSVRDKVLLYHGDPQELLNLRIRPQTLVPPQVGLSQTLQATKLRILDPFVAGDVSASNAESWEIRLSPVAPASFMFRCEGGSGKFDLTDMLVKELYLQGDETEFRVEFERPNPVRLHKLEVTTRGGRLILHQLLNANPELVVLQCPGTACELEVLGRPFEGEAEVYVTGELASMRITLPRWIGVRLLGPGAALARFDSEHLERHEVALVSRGYDKRTCRLRLHFSHAVRELSVHWEGPEPQDVRVAQRESSAEQSQAAPPERLTFVPEPDVDSDRRIPAFFSLMEDSRESWNRVHENLDQARVVLDELKSSRADDDRLPVLENWLRSVRQQVPRPQGSWAGGKADAGSSFEGITHFHSGLNYYLMGQLHAALDAFLAAQRLSADYVPAQAWIRRTEREIQRLDAGRDKRSPPPMEPPEPQIIEKIITQSIAPMFAIHTPRTPVTDLRSATIDVSGQVGDDTGIDRIEITLNGSSLLDADGRKVSIRPRETDADRRRMPFLTEIPLRKGENEIVLTAYDLDSPGHWTSESFTVIRKPPIYKTSAFGISVGAAMALGLLGFLITHAMKYRIAIVNKYNPYIAGLPIRDEAMLFGREKILRRILNTLHNNSIMIFGPRRIGKTSMQHELRRRLRRLNDPEYHYVPVFIDLQGTSEDQFFATLMVEIVEVCKAELGWKLPAELAERREPYSVRDFTRDLRKTLNLLKGTTHKTLKLVLLMDEVDQLNKYSEQVNQRLRSVFMKTFAENLVAVMSGTFIKRDWESEGSPWYNFFEQLEVGPLDREDATRLIEKPVRGIFSYEPAAIERILEYSRREPYMVQRYCIHAINRVIEDKRRRVKAADVEAVREQAIELEEEVAA
ncbi:MAG: ATP-binding protein [Candidatus Krumholzibacteriia bacterium]